MKNSKSAFMKEISRVLQEERVHGDLIQHKNILEELLHEDSIIHCGSGTQLGSRISKDEFLRIYEDNRPIYVVSNIRHRDILKFYIENYISECYSTRYYYTVLHNKLQRRHITRTYRAMSFIIKIRMLTDPRARKIK